MKPPSWALIYPDEETIDIASAQTLGTWAHCLPRPRNAEELSRHIRICTRFEAMNAQHIRDNYPEEAERINRMWDAVEKRVGMSIPGRIIL